MVLQFICLIRALGITLSFRVRVRLCLKLGAVLNPVHLFTLSVPVVILHKDCITDAPFTVAGNKV